MKEGKMHLGKGSVLTNVMYNQTLEAPHQAHIWISAPHIPESVPSAASAESPRHSTHHHCSLDSRSRDPMKQAGLPSSCPLFGFLLPLG